MYLLWSATLGGWLTKTSTYSSRVRDAKLFTYEEAVRIVQAHRSQEALGMIPVNLEGLMGHLRDQILGPDR